jgi:hypothetical protein
MKIKRFHIDIGFPETYTDLLDDYFDNINHSKIRISKHFSDKLGLYTSFRSRIIELAKNNLNIEEENIFEIYTNNAVTEIEKLCCRFKWDSVNDIILVITKEGSLVTFYFNSKLETHRYLQKELYEEILK